MVDDGKHPRQPTRSVTCNHLMPLTYPHSFSCFCWILTCLLWATAKRFQRKVTLLSHSQYFGIGYSVYLDNSQDVNSINLPRFLSLPNWLEIQLSWTDHFSMQICKKQHAVGCECVIFSDQSKFAKTIKGKCTITPGVSVRSGRKCKAVSFWQYICIDIQQSKS